MAYGKCILEGVKCGWKSNHFSVDGLYRFFSGIEVNTSDYVEIRCMGDEVSLKFYGFVIRYLFAVRRIILVTIYTLRHLKNIQVKRRHKRKRKYRWYFLTGA